MYDDVSPLIEQLNVVAAKYKKGAVKSSIRISVQPFFASAYAFESAVPIPPGAALVPVPVGELWFKEGSVVRLFKEEYVADVSYYLVCTEDRAGDESVSMPRDWIVRNFADST